jgi:transcriptional regulator with XRE-family HTH domain
LARVRRRLSQRALAARAGISYVTMRAVEAGSLLTGLGAYLAAIWALGLEREFTTFLDPDRDSEGKQLELSRTPQRARAKGGAGSADF